MTVSKFASVALIIGALGLGAFGPGGAVGAAQPGLPAPLKPGHDDPCPPPVCGGHGNGHGNGPEFSGPDFKHWDGDKGPWWANNRHDWWDDRQGPPPWGWGPPPPYQWDGGPPRPFNYWGYNVNPVWDDGFHGWGIWLFGQWIPVFGIGVS